jgi:preprotein translocase subunit SecB
MAKEKKQNIKEDFSEFIPSNPIIIKAQYTKDLSFENPNILQLIEEKDPQAPNINVNIHVEAKSLGNNDFEVVLNIQAKASLEKIDAFIVELAYAGIFNIAKEVPEESLKAIVLIECPRLLFPFARNIVAETTRDGGVPPLMLNPVDFVEMYRQQENYQESAKTKKN